MISMRGTAAADKILTDPHVLDEVDGLIEEITTQWFSINNPREELYAFTKYSPLRSEVKQLEDKFRKIHKLSKRETPYAPVDIGQYC